MPKREKCKRSPSQYNRTQCELTPGYCWVVGRGCVRVENAPPGYVAPAAACATACATACAPQRQPCLQSQLVSPLLPYASPPGMAFPTATTTVKPSALFQPPPEVKTVYRINLDTNDFTQDKEVTHEQYEAYYWLPSFRSIESNAGMNLQQKKLDELQRILSDLRSKIQRSAVFYRNFENASTAQNNGNLLLPRYKFEFYIVVLRWVLLYYFRLLKADKTQTAQLKDIVRNGLRDAFYMFTTTDAPLSAEKLFDPVAPTVNSKTQKYSVYNFERNQVQQLSKAEYYTLFNLKTFTVGEFYNKTLDKMYSARYTTVSAGASVYSFTDAYQYFTQALAAEKNNLDRKEITPSVYLTRAHILMHLMYVRLKVPYVSHRMKALFEQAPASKQAAEYEQDLTTKLRVEYIQPIYEQLEKTKAQAARVAVSVPAGPGRVAPLPPGAESVLDVIAAHGENVNVYSLVPDGFQSVYPNPNYDLHNFAIPFRMIIVGPSGTGKTTFFFNLLTKFQAGTPTFASVWIVVKDKSQSLYRWLESGGGPRIHVVEGIDSTPELESFDRTQAHLVVWDDLALTDRKYLKVVDEYYIAARHRGVSMMFLTQYYNKVPPVVRNNTNIFVLFRPLLDDMADELLQLLSFTASKENRQALYDIFQAANTVVPTTAADTTQRVRYPLVVSVIPEQRNKMFRQNLLNYLPTDKYFGTEDDDKKKRRGGPTERYYTEQEMKAIAQRKSAEFDLAQKRKRSKTTEQLDVQRLEVAKLKTAGVRATQAEAREAEKRRKTRDAEALKLQELRTQAQRFRNLSQVEQQDQKNVLASFTLAMKLQAAEQQTAVFAQQDELRALAKQIADKRLQMLGTSDSRLKVALTKEQEGLAEQRRRNFQQQQRDVYTLAKNQQSYLNEIQKATQRIQDAQRKLGQEKLKEDKLRLQIQLQQDQNNRKRFIEQTLLNARLEKDRLRALEQERTFRVKQERQHWLDIFKLARDDRKELRAREREQRQEERALSRDERTEARRQRLDEDKRFKTDQENAQKNLREEITKEKALMNERLTNLKSIVASIQKTLEDYQDLDEGELVERGALISVAVTKMHSAAVLYTELEQYAGGSEGIELEEPLEIMEMDVDEDLQPMEVEGGGHRRQLKGGSKFSRELEADRASKAAELTDIALKMQQFQTVINEFYRQEEADVRPMDTDDDIPPVFKFRTPQPTEKELADAARRRTAEAQARTAEEALRQSQARTAEQAQQADEAKEKRKEQAEARLARAKQRTEKDQADLEKDAQRRVEAAKQKVRKAEKEKRTVELEEARVAAAQAVALQREWAADRKLRAATTDAERQKAEAKYRKKQRQSALAIAEANVRAARAREKEAQLKLRRTKEVTERADLEGQLETLLAQIDVAEQELKDVQKEIDFSSYFVPQPGDGGAGAGAE